MLPLLTTLLHFVWFLLSAYVSPDSDRQGRPVLSHRDAHGTSGISLFLPQLKEWNASVPQRLTDKL